MDTYRPFGGRKPVDPTRLLTATTPHARRRRQHGAVLPLGGAVAPVAPMAVCMVNLYLHLKRLLRR